MLFFNSIKSLSSVFFFKPNVSSRLGSKANLTASQSGGQSYQPNSEIRNEASRPADADGRDAYCSIIRERERERELLS